MALLNPEGLYSQSVKELAGNVKVEIPNMTKLANPNTPQNDKDPKQVLWQIVGSFSSEVSSARSGYPKLFADQVRALTRVNPRLSEIKAPVVVMVARDDNVSQVNKIFPQTTPLSGDSRDQMAEVGRARKKHLKETHFPNAQNLEVIEASKFASHSAFGERGVQTGRVLSSMFERLRRPNTGVNNSKVV